MARFEFAQLDCKVIRPLEPESWIDDDNLHTQAEIEVYQAAMNTYLSALKKLQERIQTKYGALLDLMGEKGGELIEVDLSYPPGTDDLWYS